MDVLVSLVFLSWVVFQCTASSVYTEYNDVSTISHRNKMKYSRLSSDLAYCGTRINETDNSAEPIPTLDCCVRQQGYTYMLKKRVEVTSIKHIVEWGYFSYIPICIQNGSSIEIQLTPRTGWTRIRLLMRADAWKTVLLDTFIYPIENVLVDNELASIVIVSQADNYQVNINGQSYVTGPCLNMGTARRFQTGGVDIHKVIYTAAPEDTP